MPRLEPIPPPAISRRDRVLLWLLQAGGLVVVLVVLPLEQVDLDQFLVPKEWALHTLAALAGLFIGAEFGVESGTWIIALKALPAIIIGGLDSIAGGVVGGIAVGVVEQLFARYQSEWLPWLGHDFAGVSPYVLLLVVLLEVDDGVGDSVGG